MAGQSRTLKLSILGETKQLVDSLNSGKKSVESFEDKILDFSKKSALAFAAAATAAAAYATKLVVDGVQSAIQDEAAQLRLANALRQATGATDAQIKATEDYISKQGIQFGFTDDKLRPAFQRLTIATGDVTKSQDLLNLAMDISRGANKDLGQVVEALSKSYGGSDAALAKLGIGLTAAQVKSMTFREQVDLLTDAWGGSASDAADTLSVKLEIMRLRFDEAKEKLGTALLPVLTQFAEFLLRNVVPSIEAFVDGLVGDNSLVSGFSDAQLAAFNFGEKTKSLIRILFDLKDEALTVAKVIAGAFTASAIVGGIAAIVSNIKILIKAYNALKVSAALAAVATYLAANPLAGVAAAAVIGGALFAASKAFGASDVDADFGVTTGGDMSGGFSGIPSSGGGGGGGGGGFGGAGAGGSGGTGGVITAAVNLPDLVQKLQRVSDKIGDIDFMLSTKGINEATAKKLLNPLLKEFDLLTKQADALVGMESSSAFNSSSGISTPFNEPGTTNITVNMGVVGDPEGVKRALIDLQNEGFYRGSGGANLLQGLKGV
jgi:outer membrane protein OmpA-like peptidoglycan-associated protein